MGNSDLKKLHPGVQIVISTLLERFSTIFVDQLNRHPVKQIALSVDGYFVVKAHVRESRWPVVQRSMTVDIMFAGLASEPVPLWSRTVGYHFGEVVLPEGMIVGSGRKWSLTVPKAELADLVAGNVEASWRRFVSRLVALRERHAREVSEILFRLMRVSDADLMSWSIDIYNDIFWGTDIGDECEEALGGPTIDFVVLAMIGLVPALGAIFGKDGLDPDVVGAATALRERLVLGNKAYTADLPTRLVEIRRDSIS